MNNSIKGKGYVAVSEEFKQVSMSVSQWSSVPDCPIQRDTKAHAQKAVKNHLQKPSPTHAFVSAFELPDGRMFKLDGHTRSYLWDKGQLQAPGAVLVTIFKVGSVTEGENLYKTFDNQAASENAGDKLAGAFSKQGFVPESLLIKHGGVTSAVRFLTGRAGRNMDIYKDIIPWMPAIKLLDKQLLSNQMIPAGVLAAAILTVRIYGVDVIPFWQGLSNDEGIKSGRSRCGIQALSELITEKRAKRQTAGTPVGQELLAKSVSCVERWRKSETYTVGIKSTDIASYISEKLGDGFKDGLGSKEN